MNLKIDPDALNQHQRRFCVRRISYLSRTVKAVGWLSAHASTVYAV